jgi:hypothetical protein
MVLFLGMATGIDRSRLCVGLKGTTPDCWSAKSIHEQVVVNVERFDLRVQRKVGPR